jgi:hypothetical protein
MILLARASSNLLEPNQTQSICGKLTPLLKRKHKLQNILASKLIKQIFIYVTTVQHIPTMLFLWLVSAFSAVTLQTALTDSHVLAYLAPELVWMLRSG